jgi:hypothetical protein
MSAVADAEVYVTYVVPSNTDYYGFVSLRLDAFQASAAEPVNGYTLLWLVGDIWVRRYVGSSWTDVVTQGPSGLTPTAGMTVGVRFQIVGAVIKARMWDTAGAEPSTWAINVTDGSPYNTAGKVGLSLFNGSVGGVHSVLFDDLLVQDPPVLPAIALRAAGTSTAVAATATTLNPAVPAGATTGDLSVLCVEAKPYTTTITTPAGWTKIGETTNGTTVSGTDTGSMKVAMYVRESASAGAIGAMTLATPDSACAVIHTYSKASGYTWDYSVFTTGTDTANGANYSATGGAIATAQDDWVVAATAINTDLGTLSAQTIGGMSGDTTTVSVRTTGNTDGSGLVTTGNDSRLLVIDAQITAGSSSAAPTVTYTNASSSSGSSIWLRLRQIAPAIPPILVMQTRRAY